MKHYPISIVIVVMALLAIAGGRAWGQDGEPAERERASELLEVEPLALESLLGTAFTYQGHLRQSGTAVSGACDFQFGLYGAVSGGAQIGTTQTKSSVAVSGGLFTVASLDFGPGAFNGQARWLAIGVRCPAGAGSYTNLTPRQALTPAPYALALPGFYTLQNATSPNLIGGHISNTVSSGVVGATIGGGGASGGANYVTADYATVGGGGINTASGSHATVGGGWYNTASSWDATVGGGESNTASGPYATIGGGNSNSASGWYATAGGGWGNSVSGGSATVGGGWLNSAGGGSATVGGGWSNTASGSQATVGGGGINTASGLRATAGGGLNNRVFAEGATIGGGYTNTIAITGTNATIGGGSGNTASGPRATVGGGSSNTASGLNDTVGGGLGNTAASAWIGATVGGGATNTASDSGATVGGGYSNTASGIGATVGGGFNNTASGSSATVGGGNGNTTSGDSATVGGGWGNTASGQYATVPGGIDNVAQGDYSFAAGRQARATHDGAFVWGGSNPFNVASPAANTFNVRATGGIWLGTTSTPSIGFLRFIDTSTGAHLTTGGVWANGSDRSAKENVVPVDPQFVLAQVAALPISTWNYLAETPATRHMGPMAQDFHAAFGLGADELTIGTVDADGVALAAIQGLYEIVQAQEEEIAAHKKEIAAQQAEITGLEARLAALEKQVNGDQAALPTRFPGWLALGLGGLAAGLVWNGRQVGRR
jgi:trimeric autotransporter adhesin